MNRQIITTNHGEDYLRHDVILGGTVSAVEGVVGFAELIGLMRQIIEQPDLVRYAIDCPIEVKFYRDGEAWRCVSTCIGPRTER